MQNVSIDKKKTILAVSLYIFSVQLLLRMHEVINDYCILCT